MTRSNQGMTVVVCCHNSSRRIGPTLDALAAQTGMPSGTWDVVLVDNASTDDTVSVARRVWNAAGGPVPLTVVHEPQPGLGHARRAGVLATDRPIVAFVDDDNILDRTYLARAIDQLRARPTIGVVGGRSEARFDAGTTPPPWFSTFAAHYAVGVQALRSGSITEKGYVWGAGMVVRAGLLRALYEDDFPFALQGRSGGRLQAGDDAEISLLYVVAGYDLWYEERLVFEHYVPARRLTPEYFQDMKNGFRASQRILRGYKAAACLSAGFGSRGRSVPSLRRVATCLGYAVLGDPSSLARALRARRVAKRSGTHARQAGVPDRTGSKTSGLALEERDPR